MQVRWFGGAVKSVFDSANSRWFDSKGVQAFIDKITERFGDDVIVDIDSFFVITHDGEIIEDENVPLPARPMDFASIPTWALVEELGKRSGVTETDVGPEGQVELVDIGSGVSKKIDGPAKVMVVID